MKTREEVQDEALNISKKHGRCTLAISMRVGKTAIAIRRIEELKPITWARVLIVIPKLSIEDTWKEEIIRLDKEYLLNKIQFTTYLSLDKYNQNDWDLIIFDEVQNLLPNKRLWLSRYFNYVLGLTGTPPKSKEKVRMLNEFCPIKYTYLVGEAVDDRVLNDYQIIIHKVPIGDDKTVLVKNKKGGSFYSTEREVYNFWGSRIRASTRPKDRQIASIMRMRAMQGFPSKTKYAKKLLRNIDEKCLIFANTVEQANNISPFSYHSKNPDSSVNLDMFKRGMSNNLVCISQLSEGITIPHLNTGLILHSYSGTGSKFLQRFARTMSLEKDELATIHILCTKGTVDEDWVASALEDLDPERIKYVEFEL